MPQGSRKRLHLCGSGALTALQRGKEEQPSAAAIERTGSTRRCPPTAAEGKERWDRSGWVARVAPPVALQGQATSGYEQKGTFITVRPPCHLSCFVSVLSLLLLRFSATTLGRLSSL